MENKAVDIRPIDQWGAFYFVRKAFRINSVHTDWRVEAGLKIVKITVISLAFVVDIATGIMYLIFIVVKHLLIILFSAVRTLVVGIIERVLNILAFAIGVAVVIAVVYVIIIYWDKFVMLISSIISLING